MTDGEKAEPWIVLNVKFMIEQASMMGGNVPVEVGVVK